LFSCSASGMVRTDLNALRNRGAIVSSIAVSDYDDKTKHFMAVTKPKYDYRVKANKELYTTLQLASFGFTAASIPEHEELRDAMAWVQHLGVSTEGLFPPMFVTAGVMVCLFLVVMIAQERVEFRKFVEPKSKGLRYLWLAMGGYCQVMATVLFVPICQTLAQAGDCTRDQGAGSGSSADGDAVMWLDAMVTTAATCAATGSIAITASLQVCVRLKNGIASCPAGAIESDC
jgi:hypothetical protein